MRKTANIKSENTLSTTRSIAIDYLLPQGKISVRKDLMSKGIKTLGRDSGKRN